MTDDTTALDTAVSWAQIATPVVAALALVFVYVQISQYRQQSRSTQTYEYLRRFVDWDFAQHVSRATNLLKKERHVPLKQVEANEVMLLINFFDELAGHYNRGRLDEELVRSQFAPISRIYYRDARPFIEATREEYEDESLILDWEIMEAHLAKPPETLDVSLMMSGGAKNACEPGQEGKNSADSADTPQKEGPDADPAAVDSEVDKEKP